MSFVDIIRIKKLTPHPHRFVYCLVSQGRYDPRGVHHAPASGYC